MKKIFILLLYFSAATAFAQEQLRFVLRHDVPVSTAEGVLPQPWSGGLSAPQFSTINLNNDSQPDLFAYDRMQEKIFTWLAVQQNGKWTYKYSPDYEMLFPGDLNFWVLLRDYNCDGLKDIFTSTPLGIKVYRQEKSANQLPGFILAEEAILYNQGINLQLQSADIPAIEDMDGDGDLDVLVSEFSHGQQLEYYQNMRVENNLGCNTLQFARNATWWGGITECDGCNNYVFGAACRVAGPLHSGHTGSSLLLLDIDADGDKDLLNGAVQCDDLVLMENKGTPQQALMDELTLNFPANTRAASFRKFPAAYYEDVTFDGIPDLLVAPNLSNSAEKPELQRAVWLYQNNEAANKPEFEFVQQDFLQSRMIDLGEGAYPAFSDLDGDGDLDMLVGNNGAYRNGNYVSTLSYYQNTGTTATPAFMLVTDNYLNLESRKLLNIKPVFADMDADGEADLVLTYTDAQTKATSIVYLPALSSASQLFNWADSKLLHKAVEGDSPAFFDADRDGDLDMLLGKATGELQLYNNSGTESDASYTLTTSNLGGVSFSFDKRYLYPATTDIDGDGTIDLITTDDSGTIKVYRNLAAILNQVFTPETDVLESPFADALLPTRLGRGGSITAAALGGAGKLYLVAGTQGGGLYLLQQTSGYQQNPDAPTEEFIVEVYPNLAERDGTIVRVQASEPVTFIVYDAIGRKVYSSGNNYKQYNSLPLQNLKAGMYFLRAANRQGKYKTAKFVVK